MTRPKLHASDSVLRGNGRTDCYSHALGGEGSRPGRVTMRRLQLLIALFAALAGGLVATAPASAYNVSAIYKACETSGKLTGHYSRAELQAALNQMPSEVAEYSSCSDLIQQALLRASRGSGSGPSAHAAGVGTGGKNGGGRGGHGGTRSGHRHGGKRGTKSKYGATAGTSTPTLPGGGLRSDPASTGSSVPTALIVVLILLALAAASGAGVAIRRRLVERHIT